MSGDEPTHVRDTDLERRYRWLLAWYPWEHRRVYEDEMLGALLSDARPGQRWPAPGDAGDLVLAAVRARFRLTLPRTGDRAWHDTSAVFGLLAALLLVLWTGGLVATRVASTLAHPEYGSVSWDGADPFTWLRAGLWCVVVATASIGLPRVAASVAWAAALLEAVTLGVVYATAPVVVAQTLWLAILGVVCAATLTVPAPRRRAVSILGWPRFLFVCGCFGFLLLGIAGYAYRDFDGTIQLPILSRAIGYTAPLYLVAVVALLAAMLGVPARVRRRGLVLLGPVVAAYLVGALGFSGWRYDGQPGYPGANDWTSLAVVPLLTFALGLVLLRWREQRVRLVALGQDIDRHRPEPSSPVP